MERDGQLQRTKVSSEAKELQCAAVREPDTDKDIINEYSEEIILELGLEG